MYGEKNSNFRYLTNVFDFFLYFWCKFQLVPIKYEPEKQNQSLFTAIFFEIIFPLLINFGQVETFTKNSRINQISSLDT